MNANGFDMDGDPGPLVGLVASTVTVLTLAVAFGAMALGVEAFWVAFPVGFGGVMPLATGLAAYASSGDQAHDDTVGDDAAEEDAESALSTLRERYARGELDEGELEERVETVLATEDRK